MGARGLGKGMTHVGSADTHAPLLRSRAVDSIAVATASVWLLPLPLSLLSPTAHVAASLCAGCCLDGPALTQC